MLALYTSVDTNEESVQYYLPVRGARCLTQGVAFVAAIQ
jgi:hypothetical protein